MVFAMGHFLFTCMIGKLSEKEKYFHVWMTMFSGAFLKSNFAHLLVSKI